MSDERVRFRDLSAGVKAAVVAVSVVMGAVALIVLAVLVGLGVRLVGWAWS